jgi:hypothetical protein
MEQRDDLPSDGVYTGDVRPLVVVAREACQAQVAGDRAAAVFARDYMVDLEG